MSDPVTNIEIEDVLSSIRRLVSEETGAQPRPDPVPRPTPVVVNRLILTAALRVKDESDTAPEMDSIADPETNHVTDGTPWSDPEATLYDAADGTVEQNVPDFAEGHIRDGEDTGDFAESKPIVEVVNNTMPELAKDQMAAPVDARQSEDTPASQTTAEYDVLTPLSAKIEALEVAIGETQDQWEPDGAAGDDYAGTSVQALPWRDHVAGDAASPAEQDVDTFAPPVEPETSEPVATEPEVVTHFSDTDDVSAELELPVGDDSIIDEAGLRALVAEIVREELQGALGERITRNVRKLVRREIHRALTAQELD